MPHRFPKQVLSLALIVLFSACTPVADPTTTTTDSTTSSAPSSSTTSTPPASTTTVPATTTSLTDGPITVLLATFSEMGSEWSEHVFPYGETEEFLGTSLGGDGGTVLWGPDYGTQVTDGTWWFLDSARLRLAQFSSDGTYLDQVLVPEDLLVDGIYFQYQMPQALDDGSLAVGGFGQALVRLVDGEIAGASVDNNIPWATTDGRYLFGNNIEDGALLRLDPTSPVTEPVEWFTARDGSRYRVTVIEDEVLVELPDAGVTRTLQMRYAEDPEVIVRGAIEVDTGEDGTLHVLFYGIPMIDEPLDVGGLVTISPDGSVGQAEPTVDLFSLSDPGSPARLGVTPGTSDPWLMVVGEDGVHVFTKGS